MVAAQHVLQARLLACARPEGVYLHKGRHEERVVGTNAQVASPRGSICWIEVI